MTAQRIWEGWFRERKYAASKARQERIERMGTTKPREIVLREDTCLVHDSSKFDPQHPILFPEHHQE